MKPAGCTDSVVRLSRRRCPMLEQSRLAALTAADQRIWPPFAPTPLSFLAGPRRVPPAAPASARACVDGAPLPPARASSAPTASRKIACASSRGTHLRAAASFSARAKPVRCCCREALPAKAISFRARAPSSPMTMTSSRRTYGSTKPACIGVFDWLLHHRSGGDVITLLGCCRRPSCRYGGLPRCRMRPSDPL